MKTPTFATRWNVDLIDQYYALWQEQPDQLDPSWQAFFEGFELAANGKSSTLPPIQPDEPSASADPRKQSSIIGMIYAYRAIGHTEARFNPLLDEIQSNPRLTLDYLGLKKEDLEATYDTGNLLGGTRMTGKALKALLEETYCQSIGAEYLHIQETKERRWLQAHMEPVRNKPDFSRQKKIRILNKIMQAEVFEKFLHTRYVGQKRFGLEGGETLIAALDAIVERASDSGISEIIMGMAHRGRLNVLANIIGKSYEYIFHEFSENYIPDTTHGDGDVKYHLGYDAEVTNSSGHKVYLRLAANPSHLEAVNAVVEGKARARQRILDDMERKKVIPLLIHGDAAFAGQGTVAEVLNFSQLKGYKTGGTIHLIINNQIGFTTNPSEARSSRYCTDVAKMIEAPIFHVNGDDPEAMVWVTELALQYRQLFAKDVVIDMYSYRRHGHNESDEPAFTQPLLYRRIKSHPLISDTFTHKLREAGELTDTEAEEIRQKHLKVLDAAFHREKEQNGIGKNIPSQSNAVIQPPFSFDPTPTEVTSAALEQVSDALLNVPKDFKVNPKIRRLLTQKRKAMEQDAGIDWALAEQLAWGTLMLEGKHVRISGQDCARGTFSQRHVVLHDIQTENEVIPLMNMKDRKGMICVHNSLLSEAAVLGFDYGYSLDYPNMLCIWEAQFGDFANGAQVIIDQFIASSESKWQRISGLVMLLPHGYEGQGPEHSSARLERFLQLCADNNLQVCNITTPGQFFHVLRRQMHRPFRKPLIIMAPKSLLRNKDAVSPIADFTKNRFQEILDDPSQPTAARRLILCSGKVYYDLLSEREKQGPESAAIIRLEQIYPLHKARLQEIFKNYQKYEKVVWCQEEPANMGAWTHLAPKLAELAGQDIFYAGRPASASPAVGSLALHKIAQAAIVETAFIG